MSMSPTLLKDVKDPKNQTFETELDTLVRAASRVIAPLGPISTFAARHPWVGLEEQRFDEVADWLKNTRDVDIYPSPSVILSDKNRGEIDEAFLEMGLQRWLDAHSFNIPRGVAERFCRFLLKLEKLPAPDTDEDTPVQPFIENLTEQLNHHVIKWCKLYLDDSQAGWAMPNREEGFYQSWRRLIHYDPALTRKQRKILKDWPMDAKTALKTALSELKIPQTQIQRYLEGHLLSLPGWAGMMLWRSQQSDQEKSLLKEYLAVRISLEWLLGRPYLPFFPTSPKKKDQHDALLEAWIQSGELTYEKWSKMSVIEQKEYLFFAYYFNKKASKKLWLEAWEQTYEDQLSQKILSKQRDHKDAQAVLAQFAFCLDVRSEPFRRYLEKVGPFETIGVAGFFGLPIETSELGSHHSHPSLPVMQNAQHKIEERSSEHELTKYQQRKQALEALSFTFKKMKHHALPSLILPEISGPWLSLQMLGRSFLPRRAGQFIRHLKETWLRKPATTLSLHDPCDIDSEIPLGFTVEEQVSYVRQTLKMMSLTDDFAPLVVICGHGSQSTNNPYAASLDCGACGGASGAFNARVLATLCNMPKVRKMLATEGIEIPDETVFVAAEHNTTFNELKWIYVPELSDLAQESFVQIKEVLPKVSQHANAETISQLPTFKTSVKNPTSEAHRLAEDWSEIRPEWGLARNAAFIIGERQLTENCNLEGRVFLHNYDWKQDEDGSLLANIIAGPGTVAQWINLQYYASTVAPHFYGSGSKTTQTVTAALGVMQGVSSDLLTGLPWQSVMKSDDEAYHAPLRLLIVIQAPRENVARLLKNDAAFRLKVKNGWLRLASIDSDGHWRNW